jgi:FKBP-type peptidyl-prolyl cis-trans isomerase
MNDEHARLEGTKLANFEPRPHVDVIESIDVSDGDTVAQGATITAHYTGALCSDGTIFQSSKDMGRPVTFSLAQVIQGWQQGVPGMKVGGTRRLIIPSKMAYGPQSPAPNIPANSDLVFDIELVAIA